MHGPRTCPRQGSSTTLLRLPTTLPHVVRGSQPSKATEPLTAMRLRRELWTRLVWQSDSGPAMGQSVTIYRVLQIEAGCQFCYSATSQTAHAAGAAPGSPFTAIDGRKFGSHHLDQDDVRAAGHAQVERRVGRRCDKAPARQWRRPGWMTYRSGRSCCFPCRLLKGTQAAAKHVLKAGSCKASTRGHWLARTRRCWGAKSRHSSCPPRTHRTCNPGQRAAAYGSTGRAVRTKRLPVHEHVCLLSVHASSACCLPWIARSASAGLRQAVCMPTCSLQAYWVEGCRPVS